MNSISSRIVKLRKVKNYSRKKLAELAGVSQPTIYNIENGKAASITLSVGKRIAKALDISFAELFEIENTGTEKAELEDRIKKLEEKVGELTSRLKEKDFVIEMFKNEKTRISKDISHFLEETYDMQTHYLKKMSSLSSFQKEQVQHTIINMMNTIAVSYFVVTGLIDVKELDEIIPKYEGIVRPGDPDEKE